MVARSVKAPDVALFGASVRALADSALRAGRTPICFDLFADVDLQQVARAVRLPLDHYPHGFSSLLDRAHGLPRIYTGGLENYPDLLHALARDGELWGNDAKIVRRARDPNAWSVVARGFGVEPPEITADVASAPADGTWLEKPLNGSAGWGIRPCRGEPLRAGCFLQRLVLGVPHSAAFVATNRGCTLLGATRQLVGEDWCHARPFAYCGSVGPASLGNDIEVRLTALGERTARSFALRGLFGIDFLLDGPTIRPIELNPRYTASMEIYDLAYAASIFAEHEAVFQNRENRRPSAAPIGLVGKVILFADRRVRIGVIESRSSSEAGECEWLADIPAPGSVIDPADPVLTLLVRGACLEEVVVRLKRAAIRFRNSPSVQNAF